MDKTVDVRDIEGELTQLWREAVGPAVGSAASGVRPSFLNLVIYASGTSGAERADQVVMELGMPCRAVVAVASNESGAAHHELNARIALRPVKTAAPGQLLHYEQITLAAQGSALRDLVGTVLPLLLPEAPVLLWWMGIPPLGNRVFEELARVADRLILDSAEFQRPVDALINLSDWMQGLAGKPHVSDMNWSRLTPWRELTAQFFDAPALLPYLPQLYEITAEYAAGDGDARPNPAQGLLVAGWLASRLGWRPASEVAPTAQGEIHLQFRQNGDHVAAAVRPAGDAQGAPAGTIVRLQLKASGDPPATFTIHRAADGVCLETAFTVGGGHPVTRVVLVPIPGDAQLLHNEFDVLGRDRIYEDAVRVIAGFRPQTVG